jgi:hypothetical protein
MFVSFLEGLVIRHWPSVLNTAFDPAADRLLFVSGWLLVVIPIELSFGTFVI